MGRCLVNGISVLNGYFDTERDIISLLIKAAFSERYFSRMNFMILYYTVS